MDTPLFFSTYHAYRITGDDAFTFLQGQFSADLRQINANAQITAYCNAQGKTLATPYLSKNAQNDWLLYLPSSLSEQISKRLKLYVLRSNVCIDHISSNVGLEFTTMPIFHLDLPSTLSAELFAQRRIRAGYPEITHATTERYLPQMLNLLALAGVSLQKGCYVGQEAVARLYYKSQNHRLLSYANSPTHLPAGAVLYHEKQAVGEILASAESDAGIYCQAVVLDRFFHQPLRCLTVDALKFAPYS